MNGSVSSTKEDFATPQYYKDPEEKNETKLENILENSKVKFNKITCIFYWACANQFQMSYDATGCFHWCTSRSLEECTLTREESTVTMFAGHIIVAIFAEDDSPLLGLRLG